MRKRLLLVALLAGILSGQKDSPVDDDVIQMTMGPNKSLTVRIGPIKKADLVDIMAVFFSKGGSTEPRFRELLGKTSTLTIVLTSERGKR